MIREPGATYRLQMQAGFGFAEAAALVPYLHDLGITHLYLSPVFQARSGSTHGYDTVNPQVLSAELGGEEAFEALSAEASRHGMGLLLDIVPNHMAASTQNPWWMDVLENGVSSPFAAYFDIDWDPAQANIEEKVLLPILSSPFGKTLEKGELRIGFEHGGFHVNYFEYRLPLAPESYVLILGYRLDGIFSSDSQQSRELTRLIEAFSQLPARVAEPGEMAARHREKERLKSALGALAAADPEVAGFIEENLRLLNGQPGFPASFNRLERILDAQYFQLALWKVAKEKVNYRRFFDISDLVSLRSAEPEVFRATHALVLRLAREAKTDGVRVDHVDGLYDPLGYLRRLRDELPADAYVVVEKILLDQEPLPDDWPVEGTTGYDFLAALNPLFVDPDGLAALTLSWREFTGEQASFEDLVRASKSRAIHDLFAGDVAGLAHYLTLLGDRVRHARDLSPRELAEALTEVSASLPVYRTYVRGMEVGGRDRDVVERAAAMAIERRPELADAVAFVRQVLLLEFPEDAPAALRRDWLRFVMRWQQVTGPMTAKGFEDNALYIYNPLTSMNEVGGGAAARQIADFHEFNSSRRHRWPFSMNATATHDTKRGEDVRARIHVISEFSGEWGRRVRSWTRANRSRRRGVPDAGLETLLYQALLGAWPADDAPDPDFAERMRTYARKAARENKGRTSWLAPNADFERGLDEFIGRALDPANTDFQSGFLSYQRKLAPYGAWNSLAQLVLKAASPGVPDFYQGTELWDLGLVDPDNRRPVDYLSRRAMLDELRSGSEEPHLLAARLLANWRDGRVKLFVTWKALQCRRARARLFTVGNYVPIDASGGRAANVVAFARRLADEWVIAAAPRLTARFYTRGRPPLGRAWLDTVLPLPEGAPGRWKSVFTDREVKTRANSASLELRDVFADFPVALLAGEE